MVSEREKTLEGLRVAVQMEIDGKAYYLRASQASGNDMGRKLLERLSVEEDFHRQKFEEIYRAVEGRQQWPAVDIAADRPQRLKTLFAEEAEHISAAAEGPATELDAVQTAMDMENKTYDFYKARSRSASFAAERDFYEAVAAEESVHHALLRDYYQYLKDPAQWFTLKEHPSLDG